MQTITETDKKILDKDALATLDKMHSILTEVMDGYEHGIQGKATVTKGNGKWTGSVRDDSLPYGNNQHVSVWLGGATGLIIRYENNKWNFNYNTNGCPFDDGYDVQFPHALAAMAHMTGVILKECQDGLKADKIELLIKSKLHTPYQPSGDIFG